MKKIVYIGNYLKGKNPTTMELLTQLLSGQRYSMRCYSNKQHPFFRLIDMCWGVLKNRDANYILIDTYSTLNFFYALIVSQLARMLSVPYIPILHGGNLPNRLKFNPRLSNLIFKNSAINVAPSNYLKSAFEKKKYQTIFIPNAIELKNYEFKSTVITSPKLLWVRAFNEIYNPKMAIKVLAELKKKYPAASLCMVGPDKDGSLEQCTKLAKELDVIDAIEFTGLLSKNEWIEKSTAFDIFINTTTIDNTPVSVLEAMALGLVVVSTNVGGVPYLITDTKTGVLVPSKDVEEMVKAIERIVNHPNETKQISLNARALVENFDVTIVKKQWHNLLQ